MTHMAMYACQSTWSYVWTLTILANLKMLLIATPMICIHATRIMDLIAIPLTQMIKAVRN